MTGWPLGHSVSPQLHRAALSSAGLAGDYDLYPVPPLPAGRKALLELLARVRRGEIRALNITIPHKRSVIPFLDVLSPEAQAAVAVNTVWLSDEGLRGENTDIPGFMADLAVWGLTPQQALVLGAGGAGRAVVYGLLKAGWRIFVSARRLEQAESLALDLLPVIDHSEDVIRPSVLTVSGLRETLPGTRLIVNTTPVGMVPRADQSPWPSGLRFPSQGFLYDLVYNPPVTTLMRTAFESGLTVRNGLGMLVEQAALSFELWTSRKADRSAMWAAVATLDV